VHPPLGLEGLAPCTAAGDTWAYWRPAVAGIVELGTVRGTDVGLPVHFHDEDQITFVIAGQRRFLLGDAQVTIAAGRGLCIPAGMAHRSLPESGGVLCMNLYLRAGEYDTHRLLDRLAKAWPIQGAAWDALVEHARRRHRDPYPPLAAGRPLMSRSATSVRAAASEFAMSREGYSRAFRRRYGLPPQAFDIVRRLNHARGLLRAGTPPADAAALAGFADQSHLGRCFRRIFGVTPARYRAG